VLKEQGKMGMVKIFLSLWCVFFSAMVFALNPPPPVPAFAPGINGVDLLQKAMMSTDPQRLPVFLGMTARMKPGIIPDAAWEATIAKAKYLGKEDRAQMIDAAHPNIALTVRANPFTYLDSVDWVLEKMEMHPSQFKTLLGEFQAQGVMDSLEKRFLEEREHPVLISDEVFLADFLILKGLNRKEASSEINTLKRKYPDRFKKFGVSLFLKQLKDAEEILDYASNPQPTTFPPDLNPIQALETAVMDNNIRVLKRLMPMLHLGKPIWQAIFVEAKYFGREDQARMIQETYPEYLSTSPYPSDIDWQKPFTYLDYVDWIIKKMEMDPSQFKVILKEAQGAMDALEKRFLEKNEHPILISDEVFLADLLALKHLNKDGAVLELKTLKIKYPDRFEKFDDFLFVFQLDCVFRNWSFNQFGDRFSKNKWKGHTQAIRAFNQDTALSGTLEKKDMQVTVLGTEHTLDYSLWKNSDAPPQSIVIQVYAGYGGAFSCTPDYPPLNFGDPSILSIYLELWDCKSDIDQAEQLTAKNFKTTHFSYLLGVSQFIAQLEKDYPGAKIYLMGQSFGGFFVTSYALLQSVLEQHIPLNQVYQEPFAIDTFKTLGPKALSKIHGFISTSGAIYYFGSKGPGSRGMAKPGALKNLNIPGFFSFNYDDDRVKFDTVKPWLNSAPRGLTELFVDREAAQDYGRDLGEDGSLQSTTTRGHFSSQLDPAQMLAIEAFIHRTAANQPQSKLQLEVQDRRRNIYLGPRDEQKEQYLSNLSNTQHLIETKRKTDKDLTLSKEELAKRHLEDIEAYGDGVKPEEEKLRQATATKKIWKAAGARVAEDPSSKEKVRKKIQLKKEILKKSNSRNFGLASPPPPPVKVKDGSL